MAKNFIAPIPKRWSDPVIKLLEEGDPATIEWTFTALNERLLLGFHSEDMAYKHCIKTLRTPNLMGECVVDMRTKSHQKRCEAWAFLCPHPLNSPTPLFAKIGLHEDQLNIDLFSLHIDRKGDLQQRIEDHLNKKR